MEAEVPARYRPLEAEVNFCNSNFPHLLLQNPGPSICHHHNNNNHHHVVNLQMSWGELWVGMPQWYMEDMVLLVGVYREDPLAPQICPIFNSILQHLEGAPQIVIHCTILVNVLQTKNV